MPSGEKVCAEEGEPSSATEAQPLPAPAPGTEASQDSDGLQKAQHDLLRPTCPRCGLPVPENRLRSASPTPSRALGPATAAHGGAKGKDRSWSKRGGAGSHQAAPTPADSCFQLLLACLWCRFSAALLGLLEACSSCSSCCLQGLCSPCCHGCARCCSAVQDTTAEELSCPAHCHWVLFESCCEPTECLEFCLDCCEICHRS